MGDADIAGVSPGVWTYSHPRKSVQGRDLSTPQHLLAAARSCYVAQDDRASLQIIVLEFSELFHGAEEIGDLGQDGIFQNGLIGDEGVGGGDPFYRRVEVMK